MMVGWASEARAELSCALLETEIVFDRPKNVLARGEKYWQVG